MFPALPFRRALSAPRTRAAGPDPSTSNAFRRAALAWRLLKRAREPHPCIAPELATSTSDRAWLASVGRFEARKFEAHAIVATLGQLPRAVFDGVPDGLDPPQRQRFRRIDFERNEFAGKSEPLSKRQPLRRASDGLFRITG